MKKPCLVVENTDLNSTPVSIEITKHRLTQQRFTCENSTAETVKNRCEICSKLKIKTLEQRQ